MTQDTGTPYRVTLEITPHGYHLEAKDMGGHTIATLSSTQVSRGMARHDVDLDVLWDHLPSYDDLNDAIDSLYGQAFEVASALYEEHRSGEDE